MEQVKHLLQKIICIPVRVYQYAIRPFLAPSCRFYPSCSQYALLAFSQYGVIKGLKMTCWRLFRCNPWNPGGFDPVLPNNEKH